MTMQQSIETGVELSLDKKAPNNKEKQQAEIEKHKREFLDRGGKIEVAPENVWQKDHKEAYRMDSISYGIG